MTGSAWTAVKRAADGALGAARVADQNSTHDVSTLAIALVAARTGDNAYRAKAAAAILSAIGTESGGGELALSRNLAAYVIAADLIDLAAYDPAGDQKFRGWLSTVRSAGARRRHADLDQRASREQLGDERRCGARRR